MTSLLTFSTRLIMLCYFLDHLRMTSILFDVNKYCRNFSISKLVSWVISDPMVNKGLNSRNIWCPEKCPREKITPEKSPRENCHPEICLPPPSRKIASRKNVLQENELPDNCPPKNYFTRFLLLLTISYSCSFLNFYSN